MAKFLGTLPSKPYRSFLVLAVTLTATIPFEQAMARGGGIAGYSGKSGGLTCTDCHSAGPALPTVSLTGATSLATGAAATYTFTINGGPAVAASLDIAASGGTLAPVSTGTKLLGSEIVHTTGAPFPASGAVFNFKWTAPAAAGTYTLFAAGLSSNDTGSGGDGTKTTSLKITVTAATPATPPATTTPQPAAQNPTASIVAPTTGVAGAAVSFDASKSTAPTGRTLASYDWNFGDNTAGSGANVTHTYIAGSYTATLKVTDSTGATASATSKIAISAAGTSAVAANAGGPYTGTTGVPVQFDATGSTAPGGTISSYTWNFGDNTSGTGVKPTHTYTVAGNFTAKVTVSDNTNTNATSSAPVSISAAGTTPPPANQSVVGAPRFGQRVFDAHCASCHLPTGAGTPGSASNIIGSSSREIAAAIAAVPVMNTPALNALSRIEVRAISHFLRGEKLYQANCESCHGVGGVGTVQGTALIGATDIEITNAIAVVPVMQTPALMGLTARQIDLIAFFLPRDPLAVASIRGIRSRALTPSLDQGNDYPQLDLADPTAVPAARGHLAPAAGSLDVLALCALGALALRRRRK